MNLMRCVACDRPVLSFPGEFEMLDSYYLGDDSPPADTAGKWHSRCLHDSPYREEWYAARLRNFTAVRGYREVAETEAWTVVRHPRTDERIGFSRNGDLLGLTFDGGPLRKVPGGTVYGESYREFNLELDDEAAIRTIQDSLRATKKYPVLGLFDLLGIMDRVVHPEALKDAAFVWTRPLAKLWQRTWVSARCEYGVSVPAELEPYVSRKKPGAGGG